MRNWIALLGIVTIGLTSCSVPEDVQFDGEKALQLVYDQVHLGPRIPGSPGHWQAGEWIIANLESLGWEIEQQIFDYRGIRLRNIKASYPDSNEEAPVLLGAHYDTRPLADRDRSYPQLPVPGANDGASGVAVLLELARVLSIQPVQPTVWLLFFDAEDSGGLQDWEWIVGSTQFASEMKTTPQAVIIIDMVGDQNLELYYEFNSDSILQSQLWKTATELGFQSFIPETKYHVIDDHIPFARTGIPAIDIIDLDYPFWHTTEDTLDKVSAISLEEVGRTIHAWLKTLP